MEQILRGEEVSEVNGGKSGDAHWPVYFFPIRHHSPVCAFHLKKAIEAFSPDCLLIEGPENAEEMIPVLNHEDTKAPIALYYFYKDKKGLLGEKGEAYKCYYPFLDCSPELLALREAKEKKIPARFIDLPYGEILLGTQESRGIRTEGEKQTYNDDYLLGRSKYIERLCEKTGLRSFEEIWEKFFEIGGLFLSTEDFVRQMTVYCALSREHTPMEELKEDGCLLRERYMAWRIAKASEKYRRILAVTGGFHTEGLKKLLKKQGGSLVYTGEEVKLHNFSGDEQGVYPLAYSMEAADALNGYASGMQSPGFYHQVWTSLSEREQPKGAYEQAVLHQLVSAGRWARKKGESISSYDVICAFSMAKGLAALREKREPGLAELKDAALSCFVKGEYNPSTRGPVEILRELNTGRQTGVLCADALRPPVLVDFEEQCRKYGFKIQSAAKQEVTLELFTKKKHLMMSRFLYQMDFLETGFARRIKGADLVNRRDKSRIREVWTYRFSGSVLAALADVSSLGGTVEEASRGRLVKKLRESGSGREAARLLAQGFLMGFLEETAKMGSQVKEALTEDGDFFSLAEAFSHLRMLCELQELYQVEDSTELFGLLEIAFRKTAQLLPAMAQVKEERQQACMEHCLSLYQITGRERFRGYRQELMEAFERMLAHKEIRPGLEGAVLGLLYGDDGSCEERVKAAAAGYLQGAGETQMKSAAFLRGLFYTARDFVFAGKGFLSLIDGLLGELSGEDFMKLLPELRQAFGYFTPLEIDRIAREAARLNGAEKRELFRGRIVSPLEYEYGEALDAYATGRM